MRDPQGTPEKQRNHAMSTTVVGNLAVELGVKDDQLQAGLAQAVVQAQQAGQRMAQAVNQGSQRAVGGGGINPQGLLNISRAIDDVQYGFRGIINNIEGIVTGLGMGAGVAGAATIAAVALNALVPRVLELVGARSPMQQLADTIRGIGSSGINGTFAGMAANARATEEALKASIEVLRNMELPARRVIFAAGGPGMGAAPQAQVAGDDPRKVFAQRLQVNELAQAAARDAFIANRTRQNIAAGGLASFEQTTAQKEQTKINQQIFQSAIDRFGGGQQLFEAIKAKNLGGASLFGEFMQGDIKATEEIVRLLNLQGEKAKAIADDYERVTGSAAELRRIEDETSQKSRQTLNRQFNEYENAVRRQDALFSQRDEIMLQRNRSEILGSAAEAFARNINAGQEDPQLKKLDEIKDEIRNLGTLTGILH